MKWYLGCITLITLNFQYIVDGAPQVPCYFIFGDSLADSGNNNNLVTSAKVNFLPYGIDYPGGPTGRFTNGRNYVDFLAEFLGFEHHIPPYMSAQGNITLQGVNYASGGAGIRPETGKIVGDRISLDGQLANHRLTATQITALLGKNETLTKEYLGKCLYSVGIGSNDYMNNYLQPELNPANSRFTPDRWAHDLHQRYQLFLKNLYEIGARKVVLFGLGPVGCEPFFVAAKKATGIRGCVDTVNRIIGPYNSRFGPLVDDLNKNLDGAKFIFVNTSHISPGTNPEANGFRVHDTSCCQTVPVKGTCITNSPPCSNRSEYSFWDNYHPTERGFSIWVNRAWKASTPQDVYPMDISQLLQLQL